MPAIINTNVAIVIAHVLDRAHDTHRICGSRETFGIRVREGEDAKEMAGTLHAACSEWDDSTVVIPVPASGVVFVKVG